MSVDSPTPTLDELDELALDPNITANRLPNVEGTIQSHINMVAPVAIGVLSRHVRGRRKSIKPSLQRACEYIIDHAIGKAKVKVEHSGGTMTYADLMRGVEDIEKNPPQLLVNVQVNILQSPVPTPAIIEGQTNAKST